AFRSVSPPYVTTGVAAVGLQRALSLDGLVCPYQQRLRDRQPKRLRGLEVDDQLELSRLQDRQVRRPLTFENPAAVDACLAICVGDAAAVAHQAAEGGELAPLV